MLNHYETVFITTPVLSEIQVKEAVEKFKAVITENGGNIEHEEAWGLRKLIRFLTFRLDKYAYEYALKRRAKNQVKQEEK